MQQICLNNSLHRYNCIKSQELTFENLFKSGDIVNKEGGRNVFQITRNESKTVYNR